jgi:hypothetical protein
MIRALGKYASASRAYAGGVAGSSLPEIIRIGASLRTGSTKADGTGSTFQNLHARCCARTRASPSNVSALSRVTSASVMKNVRGEERHLTDHLAERHIIAMIRPLDRNRNVRGTTPSSTNSCEVARIRRLARYDTVIS